MIYKGALKYGSLDIDCKPCVVRGTYFFQNDVLVVSAGIVMFKLLDDIVIVTKDKTYKVPVLAFEDLLLLKGEATVMSV